MTISIDPIHATAGPGLDELVGRARSLRPLLRKNSAAGDENRRVQDESIEALKDAGLFRLHQPKRYGGFESSARALVDVSAAVGEADGGTAWVVSLLNSGAWLVGGFPQEAQDEVWGANPEALVSGVFSQRVQSKKVPGGHRITGEWFYSSGSLHADWAVVSAPLTNDEGQVVDLALALIPRSDFDVNDTWYVVGMRASGSNCITVKDVFVPDHRLMSVPRAIEGVFATEHKEERLYSSPLGPLFTIGMVGPQLGLGRAALEIVQEQASKKGIANTIYTRQADSVPFQIQLAEASLMIDTAHFHAHRAADDMDSAAADGETLDFFARTRIRGDVGWAIQHITKSIDTLLYANGSSAFGETNHLQRIWRDSAVASRHAGILPTVCYEIYGKGLVGSEERISPVI